MPKGIGYSKGKGNKITKKQRGGNAGTGKKSVKNYDPKTTGAGGGGGKPKVAKMYSPPTKIHGKR